MSLVIIGSNRKVSEWINGIREIDDAIPLEVWPDIKNKEAVLGAVVWNHPEGSLQMFPNLKFISSMGAGVDHVLKDTSLPAHVPIVRIIDSELTHCMANYIIMAVSYHHRKLEKYIEDKENMVWDQETIPDRELSIGVMGMGVLGTDAAVKLSKLGFKVCEYSNTPKKVEGVKSFAGKEALQPFIEEINVLICLLPLTTQTKDILNIELFKRMNRGTYLINVARGNHLVEEDLLTAIDQGYISGAFLDVFREEPLPKAHPFWSHPKIMMTPHIASITNPQAAIPQVVDNYRAVVAGRPLQNEIDRNKEY